jgi:hypothetical protein
MHVSWHYFQSLDRILILTADLKDLVLERIDNNWISQSLVAILGTPDDVVIEVVYVASSMDDIWLIISEFVFNHMSRTFFQRF